MTMRTIRTVFKLVQWLDAARFFTTHLRCVNTPWLMERDSTYVQLLDATRSFLITQSSNAINSSIQVRNPSNVHYAENASLWTSIWGRTCGHILARNRTYAPTRTAIRGSRSPVIWRLTRRLISIKSRSWDRCGIRFYNRSGPFAVWLSLKSRPLPLRHRRKWRPCKKLKVSYCSSNKT